MDAAVGYLTIFVHRAQEPSAAPFRALLHGLSRRSRPPEGVVEQVVALANQHGVVFDRKTRKALRRLQRKSNELSVISDIS